MLEPRRPAARLAAAHMADLLGEPVGETVGYQVRFERRIGPRTRIEVVTEGILTRRLQQDPELAGVGLLIFDEFHERSLQADLGLALALDVVAGPAPGPAPAGHVRHPGHGRARPALLGGAPVIQAEGRAWPVELVYAERSPGPDPLARRGTGGPPGPAPTRRGRPGLPPRCRRDRAGPRAGWRGTAGRGHRVLPLHGSLSLEDQDLALVPEPGGRRRVVLATDIAETSVTIEGVGVVVDCGLTRKPRFAPGSGLTRLVTEPSRGPPPTSAPGGPGALAPGSATGSGPGSRRPAVAPHRPAEILQADLAPLALDLALWGVRDPGELAWLDPPPAARLGRSGRPAAGPRRPGRRGGSSPPWAAHWPNCPCTRGWRACCWPPATAATRAWPPTWPPCSQSVTAGSALPGRDGRSISACASPPWSPAGPAASARDGAWAAGSPLTD